MTLSSCCCLPSFEAVGPYRSLLLLLLLLFRHSVAGEGGVIEGPQARLEAAGVQSSSDAWWQRVVDDTHSYQHMGRHTTTTENVEHKVKNCTKLTYGSVKSTVCNGFREKTQLQLQCTMLWYTTAHLLLLAACCSVSTGWAWRASVSRRLHCDQSILVGSLLSRWSGNHMSGLQMVSEIEPSPLKALVDISAAGYRWISHYAEVQVPSLHGIHLSDITKQVQAVVEDSGVLEGQVNVLSRHTTTAITINEMEGRLVDDVRQYLLKLAPAFYPYLHNDLHLRKGPPGMVVLDSIETALDYTFSIAPLLRCRVAWRR